MTLIDALIILILLAGLFRGFDEGLLHQLFSTIGFFFGLFLGAAVEPHLIDIVHSSLSKLIVALAITLGFAFLFLFVGEVIGIIAKRKVGPLAILNRVDNALGAALGGVAMILLVWLGSAVIVALPYPALQQQVNDSAIVTLLTRRLPAAPNIIAGLGHLIVPNGFPNVFIGKEPTPAPVQLPSSAAISRAVLRDQASVVKIEGQGCGGMVFGSGFVVGNGFVATNAHVVAGITAPQIVDKNGAHAATTVWFDPDLDFAVLRTSNLAGAPLSFNTATASRGEAAGVLGYPGGGSFSADRAAILDEFTAIGRNIYGQGRTSRDVYSVQATVVPGNSGGPLIDVHGYVIGVVFATSTTYDHVGYALTLRQVVNEVNQAQTTNHAVSTGSCAE